MRVAQIVNQIIYYGIWFAVAMAIVQLVKDLRRLIVRHALFGPKPQSAL